MGRSVGVHGFDVQRLAAQFFGGLLHVGVDVGLALVRGGDRSGVLGLGVVGLRVRCVRAGQLGEPTDRLQPPGCGGLGHRQVDEVVDVGDPVPVHPQHAGPLGVADLLRLRDELDEMPERGLVEAEPHA